MSRLSLSIMVVVALSLALAIAAACTKEVVKEVQVPGETIIVEKEVVKEVQVPGETIVVEKVVEKEVIREVEVVKIVEVEAMAGRPVPGTILVAAVPDVGPPLWHTPVAPIPVAAFDTVLAVGESFIDLEPSGDYIPMLARSWDIDDEGITWHIQPGVPFQDSKYGTITAEDVMFSFNAGLREGTISAHALHFQHDFENARIVDRGTVRWDWTEGPVIRWLLLTRHSDQGITIESEKYYDEVGEDFFMRNPMQTGPYMVTSHVADDQITLEAVKNHWRHTGGFEKARIIEVPEQLTRIAMLKSGNADYSDISITLIDQVENEPGLRIVIGALANKAGANVFMGGNWQIPAYEDGTPNAEPILSNPWVGKRGDAADNERAKKIRLAMGTAIDRELLVETILGGNGCVSFIYTIDTCSSRYDPKWSYPFDLERAKELLAEGGQADGFEFDYWIPFGEGTHMEISEAFIPMWEAIGLTATVDKSEYAARRPEIVGRTMKDVWSFSFAGNLWDPVFFADVAPDMTTRVLWNGGYDHPDGYAIIDALLPATDPEDAWAALYDFWDLQSHLRFMPNFGTVSWTDPVVIGPNIGEFNQAGHGVLPELDRVEPAAQ